MSWVREGEGRERKGRERKELQGIEGYLSLLRVLDTALSKSRLPALLAYYVDLSV